MTLSQNPRTSTTLIVPYTKSECRRNSSKISHQVPLLFFVMLPIITMQEKRASSPSHKPKIQYWLKHNNIPSDLDISKSLMLEM
jgi:hypothetical protein